MGSGFGGSVAAYRLAQAGRSVVLLERGKTYPPGGFARTPAEMSRNFWDPSEGLHGLFNIWAFPGLYGVVSSGLGGGSLIYANVLLRKDERWFVHESPLPGGGYEHWPIGRADLDPHYAEVERMLGATPYPYSDTAKTVAMRESAERLGLRWSRPPLAVSFAGAPGEAPMPRTPIAPGEFPNLHGLPRSTCKLCGECDIGCNDGAKNTLDHTYLSAAKHYGADLRTRSEVRGISPLPGGGYEVRYVVHLPENEGRKLATSELPLRAVRCDRLVLAAGALGTSYLLLRNRSAFPGLSRTIGTRFCGNGDLLTFLVDAKDRATGATRRIEGSRGTVITSAIRVGDDVDGDGSKGRGFYIQDAGYPAFAEWLFEAAQLPDRMKRVTRFAAERLQSRLRRSSASDISASLSSLLGPGALGQGSMPLLGMGRDIPDGIMRLREGYLDVTWTTATSEDYFHRLRETMREIAEDLGARFIDNPIWWAKQVVTVHPLGGAPMGRHPEEGTCDEFGEVFGFPGLHVLDGALLPGSVGANPALTIAAVADRACDRILSSPPAPPRPRTATAEHKAEAAARTERDGATGLSFTEKMRGFIALGIDNPERGAELGRHNDHRLMFRLTITTDDVDAFVADADHMCRAEGYVDCDMLGGRLEVVQGWFNLFTKDGDDDRRRMLYRLHLADTGGNHLTLVGFKDVHDDAGADVWRDTSTLYVRVLADHVMPAGDEDAKVIASGVITIHVPDFLRQLTTFTTSGPRPAHAFAQFGRLFLGELWEVYGSFFSDEDPDVERDA
ncbi:GMC oxidoreductase [Sinosporangium siamense]|uniref:GMC oxidoreductase n=1 Tax=Sinosporangium siamense TaxID=1367973 RepID=UPI001EF2FB86|nr:GMC oxidoreductase [Sinosporangium siamense]